MPGPRLISRRAAARPPTAPSAAGAGTGSGEQSRPPARGFTLFEVVVALAVMAILAALLVPLALRALTASGEEAARTDMQRIYAAIVGDPEQGSFGYLGDMGRLPSALTELVEQGSQPPFTTTGNVGGVGTGWRGPYLTGPFATADLLRDPWGEAFAYAAGQIRSGGPDRVLGTADDLVFPVQGPVQTTGTLLVTVVVNDIPQPSGLTVEVFSTVNGVQGAPVTRTTAADGHDPFRFTVPHGVSVVRATHTSGVTTVSRTVTVAVVAGTQVSRQIVMKTSAAVAM